LNDRQESIKKVVNFVRIHQFKPRKSMTQTPNTPTKGMSASCGSSVSSPKHRLTMRRLQQSPPQVVIMPKIE